MCKLILTYTRDAQFILLSYIFVLCKCLEQLVYSNGSLWRYFLINCLFVDDGCRVRRNILQNVVYHSEQRHWIGFVRRGKSGALIRKLDIVYVKKLHSGLNLIVSFLFAVGMLNLNYIKIFCISLFLKPFIS